MSRHHLRLAQTMLALLVVTIVTILAAPIPARAAGDCTNHSVAGFTIGVCINDGNTNFHVAYSDEYVNSYPSGSWSCGLYIEQWSPGIGKLFQNGPYSCRAGHTAAPSSSQVGSFSEWIHTSVWISLNGVFYRIGDSPSFEFCSCKLP